MRTPFRRGLFLASAEAAVGPDVTPRAAPTHQRPFLRLRPLFGTLRRNTPLSPFRVYGWVDGFFSYGSAAPPSSATLL